MIQKGTSKENSFLIELNVVTILGIMISYNVSIENQELKNKTLI